jgi:hypothetical protein
MVKLGWALFLVGSLIFAADAVRVRDAISAIGSVLFVVGVIAFVIAERLPPTCRRCSSPIGDPQATVAAPCSDWGLLDGAESTVADHTLANGAPGASHGGNPQRQIDARQR